MFSTAVAASTPPIDELYSKQHLTADGALASVSTSGTSLSHPKKMGRTRSPFNFCGQTVEGSLHFEIPVAPLLYAISKNLYRFTSLAPRAAECPHKRRRQDRSAPAFPIPRERCGALWTSREARGSPRKLQMTLLILIFQNRDPDAWQKSCE